MFSGCDFMNSVWTKNSKPISFEPLRGNVKTDVLIIGGGLAGLLCAEALRTAGVDYILVEAKNICGGITKNTTAKLTIQHGLFCDEFIKKFGEEKTKLYIEAQTNALDKFSKLCETIDCDFEKKDSYVYSLNDRQKIENELKALERLNVKAEFSKADNLPFSVSGAVKIKEQAQFNPLKFAYELAKKLNAFENTKVLELMPNKAKTENGEIRFNKAIIATHFPILNKHGGFFIKMYQHRSYVLALENASDVNGMYVDEAEKGMSFRNYKDLLLVGGGDHRTGRSGGGWKELQRFSEKYYKKSKIAYQWATQDCMSLDGMPYIGLYSKNTPDLLVATGFNKWGMTNSMVAANILCDLVREKENAFSSVFSPSRSIFHPQLAVNVFESAIGLLTPTKPRCPHLGCALKYNRAEHSWDCPCHGSRFSENGELIDNPATDDKKL